MTTLFLTTAELEELTGFRSTRHQTRWLEKNRWRFALDRREQPKVARAHFNERMGAGPTKASAQADPVTTLAQPNFKALERH